MPRTTPARHAPKVLGFCLAVLFGQGCAPTFEVKACYQDSECGKGRVCIGGACRPSGDASAPPVEADAFEADAAVARAGDPVLMARAFGQAIEAGRAALLSGMIPEQDMATPSTPVPGTPFWHTETG